MHEVLTRNRVTLETFTADPLRVMDSINGKAIAVMSAEDVEFYAVPVAMYEALQAARDKALKAEIDRLIDVHGDTLKALADR